MLKQLEDSRNKLKTSFNDMIREFLMENPDVKIVSFEGYTPEFNDGDECEFTISETEIGELIEGEYDDECEEFVGGCLELEGEEKAKMVEYINRNNDTSPKLATLYETITRNDDVEIILAQTYGTRGFRLTYYFKNGKFIILEEDYDCGY